MSESHNPQSTLQDIVARLVRELDDVIALIQRPVQRPYAERLATRPASEIATAPLRAAV